MLKKLLFLLLTVIFSSLWMEAKDKVKTTELCPFLKFEGVVEKEKGTKAKIPTDDGVLYIPGYYYDRNKNVIEIKGDFSANEVSNAVITITKKRFLSNASESHQFFSGDLTYRYQYDKKTKDFNLELVLGEGDLCLYDNSFRVVRQIPISKDMNIQMAFYNIDHGSEMQVVYSPTRLQIENNEIPQDIPISFSKYIARSIWYLEIGHFSGLAFTDNYSWVRAELKNGMTVYPDKDGIKITGKNQTGYYGSRFRLPLKDGGFFEYISDSYVRLSYPNGDFYEGSFTSVPFKYKHSNNGVDGFDAKDKIDYGWGNSKPKGDCILYSTIIESSSKDYEIGTGKYTHKSGKVERVKNGVFPDRLLENNPLVSSLPTYASLVTDAIEMSGYYAIDKFKYLCSSDFWGYIGKSGLSDLDKKLYSETDDYKSKYSQFKAAVNNQKFYTILPISGKVSTTKAQFTKGMGSNAFEKNKLPVMAIPDGPDFEFGFPLGKNSIHKNSYVIAGERFTDYEFAFDVNSTDIQFLKYLQEASEANETALLMIYKPGVYVEIDKYGFYSSIATPVSLYLINKETKTVLYDLSKYIDKDPTKYIGIFSRIVARERTERSESTYHSEPLRKHCYECGGDGIVEGVNLYLQPGVTRAICRSCNGKGYIETHYY